MMPAAIEPTAIYTPVELSAALSIGRDRVDAACANGTLRASDAKSELAKKHRWRIEGADALDWKRRGFPTTA